VKPPNRITVTMTTISVVDNTALRASLDVFLIASANAIAPRSPWHIHAHTQRHVLPLSLSFLASQLLGPSVHQSVSRSVSQSVSQSINQTNNQNHLLGVA